MPRYSPLPSIVHTDRSAQPALALLPSANSAGGATARAPLFFAGGLPPDADDDDTETGMASAAWPVVEWAEADTDADEACEERSAGGEARTIVTDATPAAAELSTPFR
jgi:hypothetical protein